MSYDSSDILYLCSTLIAILAVIILWFMCIKWPQLRAFPSSIILITATCDAMFGSKFMISSIVAVMDFPTFCPDWLAIYSEFWAIASISWHAIWCIHVLIELVQPTHNFRGNVKYYHCWAWGVSAIETVIFGVTKSKGIWWDKSCWLKAPEDNPTFGSSITTSGPYFAYFFIAYWFIGLGSALYCLYRLYWNPGPSTHRTDILRYHALYVMTFVIIWLFWSLPIGEMSSAIAVCLHILTLPLLRLFHPTFGLVFLLLVRRYSYTESTDLLRSGVQLKHRLVSTLNPEIVAWSTGDEFRREAALCVFSGIQWVMLNEKYSRKMNPVEIVDSGTTIQIHTPPDPSMPVSPDSPAGSNHNYGSVPLMPGYQCTVGDLYMSSTISYTVRSRPSTRAALTPYFNFDVMWPEMFRQIWTCIGITEETLLSAFAPSALADGRVVMRWSEGKSPSLFCRSVGGNFLLKSLGHDEVNALRALLPSYVRHIQQYPNSLLCRIVGLFTLRISGCSDMPFLAMVNVLSNMSNQKTVFDLKGSGRGVSSNINDTTQTLKDGDYSVLRPNGLFLSSAQRHSINQAIIADTSLLQGFGLMDYSLIVGIHSPTIYEDSAAFHSWSLGDPQSRPYMGIGVIGAGRPWACHHLESPTSSEHYRLGIIDFLQRYNTKKKTARVFKILTGHGSNISTVNPRDYAARFRLTIWQKIVTAGVQNENSFTLAIN